MAKRAGRKDEVRIASRLLQLFEYLRQQGFFDDTASDNEVSLPLSVIAQRLGCTRDEAIALIGTLSCCSQCSYLFVPVYFDEEHDLVISTGTFSALPQPIRLSAAECRALTEALNLTGIPKDDPLRSSLMHIDTSSPEQAPISSIEVERVTGDKVAALFSAVSQHRIVQILYRKQGASEPTLRRIEPLSFTLEQGTWYLHAFCYLRQAPRTFAVNRIESIEVTDEHFVPRDLQIEQFSARLLAGFPFARLRFRPDTVIEKRDWPGLSLVGEEDDGSKIATIPYSGSLWLPSRIASHLGSVEVIEPPALKRETARYARQLLSHARNLLATVEPDIP